MLNPQKESCRQKWRNGNGNSRDSNSNKQNDNSRSRSRISQSWRYKTAKDGWRSFISRASRERVDRVEADVRELKFAHDLKQENNTFRKRIMELEEEQQSEIRRLRERDTQLESSLAQEHLRIIAAQVPKNC